MLQPWSNHVVHIYSWCEDCIENTKCGYCYNDFGNGAVNGSCLPIEGDDSTHSVGWYIFTDIITVSHITHSSPDLCFATESIKIYDP